MFIEISFDFNKIFPDSTALLVCIVNDPDDIPPVSALNSTKEFSPETTKSIPDAEDPAPACTAMLPELPRDSPVCVVDVVLDIKFASPEDVPSLEASEIDPE